MVIARVRYGASNSVYRAEETVSGRMAATLPLPRAARGFSAAIAEKVLSNCPTGIDTADPGEDEMGLLALVLALLGGAGVLPEESDVARTTATARTAAAAAPIPAITARRRGRRADWDTGGLGADGGDLGGGV